MTTTAQLLVLAAAFLLLQPARGHGFLSKPASRNVVSRSDHYCPHCFNAGGTGAVSDASGGQFAYPETLASSSRHGLCGDPANGPQDHLLGGSSYDPAIVATYQSGANIEIEVGITAHHRGHFEFFLCDKADLANPDGAITQECLNKHQLLRAEDASHPIDPSYPGRYYLDPKCSLAEEFFPGANINARKVKMTYKLPDGLVSDFAVLQWYWVTGNTCNAPGYKDYFDTFGPNTFQSCAGDGGGQGWWAPHLGDCVQMSYPEEFWNCANIQIKGGDGISPTTPPPTDAVTPPPSLPPTSDGTEEEEEEETDDDDEEEEEEAEEEEVGDEKRLVAYIPNWKACPSAAALKHYTHALVAFAVTYPAWRPAGQDTCETDKTCTVQNVPGCGGKTLKQMVSNLQEAGVKVILSFGGASMGGVWEPKGAFGSNSCWEHCLGKVDSLTAQLGEVVRDSGADGIDVDYEYYLDEHKYRTFLSDFTEKLRVELPAPLLLTHAPMDPDLCDTTIHPQCRDEYLNIMREHRDAIDFIMPQYYNGYMRPASDFQGALRHLNQLVSYAFNGDASKVVFGFCVADCPGFNVDAASALGIVQMLDEAVPSNGGSMFWESSNDASGVWSGGIADHYGLIMGGGPSPTPPPTTSAPPPTPGDGAVGGDKCTGETCFLAGQCRSEWGWCGDGGSYCNEKSTWSPACDDSTTTPPPSTTTTPPPTTTTTPPPTTAATSPPSTTVSSCEHRITHAVTSAWGSGYNVDLSIEAGSSGLAAGWTASWALPEGETLSGGWNGVYTFDAATGVVTVVPANWQAKRDEGEVAIFGFMVKGRSGGDPPSSVAVGGTTCILGGGDESPPSESTTTAVTAPATEEEDTGEDDVTLLARIVKLLRELETTSSDDALVENVAEMIEELLALESSGATTPNQELLVVLRSTLESGYEGRGLPPNVMHAEAQQVTTDLLAVVGEAEAAEYNAAPAGEDGAVITMDTALVVTGCFAAVALIAVGVAVVVVRRARKHRSNGDDAVEKEGRTATWEHCSV